MRCFIAIDLPEEIKARIFHESEILEEKKLFNGKITEKENLHLTMRFLGEIQGEKAEEIFWKLGEIKFKKFKCSVGKTGFFENEKKIKIIWIEIVSEDLEKLEKKISEILPEFPENQGNFSPHVTIARVESIRDSKGLIENVKRIHLRNSEFEVKELFLMKSEIKNGKIKYKKIGNIGL